MKYIFNIIHSRAIKITLKDWKIMKGKEIETKIDLCLNTSFAFGGTNTILAVSRVDL